MSLCVGFLMTALNITFAQIISHTHMVVTFISSRVTKKQFPFQTPLLNSPTYNINISSTYTEDHNQQWFSPQAPGIMRKLGSVREDSYVTHLLFFLCFLHFGLRSFFSYNVCWWQRLFVLLNPKTSSFLLFLKGIFSGHRFLSW